MPVQFCVFLIRARVCRFEFGLGNIRGCFLFGLSNLGRPGTEFKSGLYPVFFCTYILSRRFKPIEELLSIFREIFGLAIDFYDIRETCFEVAFEALLGPSSMSSSLLSSGISSP